MVATAQCEFLSTRSGKANDGNNYCYTNVLSGDEVLRIYGYDPGPAAKRLDPVTVTFEQRQGKEGKLYYSWVKG